MASGGLQAASRARDLEVSFGGPPLSPLLGSSWGTVGLSGEHPGPSWGPRRGLVARLGAI
eukprot:963283-Pyramimonas_sp.AAC.1